MDENLKFKIRILWRIRLEEFNSYCSQRIENGVRPISERRMKKL